MPNPRPLHSLHAILLAFPLAFFPAALLFDIVYLNSAQLQWTNFASWLISFAVLFGGPVLLWAAIDALRGRRPRAIAYLVLVAAAWIAGLINAFQHSKDGWSSVGTMGLILSVISTLLILAAAWVAHSNREIAR
ncbi:DUF2231 domain-containing protein [Sphingoaurantiacus capsulatus]|uniref:DUF2231 domain-containing protein n=1 Tax=Sphingoaurantiacus capsulatus TaxID=1771310 RepID=A0ABV7X7H2_9SPHN